MNPANSYARTLRSAVQLWFLAFSIFVGYRFYGFVRHFEAGTLQVQRPDSVDAFLPISGFMGLKFFALTGIVEQFHPASFFVFLSALAVSYAANKGFCGWICPVGTLSEYLHKAFRKATGLDPKLNRSADIALMSIKYLLMGLFILLIGIAMTPTMMALFYISDYYRAIDVRMLKFFTDMSALAFWVLTALVVLSLIFRNFWCRYLCPYGALLGLIGRLSPFKIRRDENHCTNCGRCTRNCPSMIDVSGADHVASAECTGCLTCVASCPEDGALKISTPKSGRYSLRPWGFAVMLLSAFYFFILIAMATDNWKSKIMYDDHKRLIAELKENSP